jgi:CRP-like cAMP-binding protein
MALLDGHPRSASVTTETPCRLFHLERSAFLPVLLANAEATLSLLKILCARLRQTDILLEAIALQSLPERLAHYLLQLGETHGTPASSGIKVSFEIRQSDIADHLAASREGVNKVLNLWQQRDYIALLPANACIIKDAKALKAIANPDG